MASNEIRIVSRLIRHGQGGALFVATIEEFGLTTRTTKDPFTTAARLLIEHGVDPARVIRIYREENPTVATMSGVLGKAARMRISDTRKGLRTRKIKPKA